MIGRLENFDELVRKMVSGIVLVFFMVVDSKNFFYLDDSCRGESIDWEFGLVVFNKGKESIELIVKLI